MEQSRRCTSRRNLFSRRCASEERPTPHGIRARKHASSTEKISTQSPHARFPSPLGWLRVSDSKRAKADVIFSVGVALLRSERSCDLQILEGADHLGQCLFGISEEESGLWIIEKLVLDTGESWAHRALEEDDVCRIGNLENRHSVDRAAR